jgi:hypothetical protein
MVGRLGVLVVVVAVALGCTVPVDRERHRADGPQCTVTGAPSASMETCAQPGPECCAQEWCGWFADPDLWCADHPGMQGGSCCHCVSELPGAHWQVFAIDCWFARPPDAGVDAPADAAAADAPDDAPPDGAEGDGSAFDAGPDAPTD